MEGASASGVKLMSDAEIAEFTKKVQSKTLDELKCTIMPHKAGTGVPS